MSMPTPPPGQGPIDPSGAFGRPPMMPMFLPAPRRGGLATAILTTLATTIFALSILLNIYLLIYSGLLSGAMDFEKTTIQKGSSSGQIIALPISGLIDDAMAERFEKALREIDEHYSPKAIVLEIDSPGGGVTASDQMYADLLRFKEKKHIPVVSAMGSVAASGGYYVACATDKIVAQRTSITGSIGVLMPRYDLSALAAKYGVVDDSLIATGATYKNVGSPLQPLKPEDRAYLTGIIDSMFANFKATVVKGRGSALKQPIDQLAVGKVFTGEEALTLGLVDQLGYQPDAYQLAASLANVSDPEVIRLSPSSSWLAAFGQSRSRAAAAGQVNVNIDSSILERLNTSGPQYLWRAD